MDRRIDLRVTELLASRLCHDLVGPVGAINNGLELIEDERGETDGMSEEALALVMDSARRTAVALQFFRLAYGLAGSRLGGDLTQIRDLAGNLLAHRKAKLDWAKPARLDGAPDGLGKLLLNMILLAAEALPQGGTVSVVASHGDSGFDVSVTAVGERAGVLEEARPALADQVDVSTLTPRSVHAYFTRLLARQLGADLAWDTATAGRVVLTVNIAA